MTRLEVLVGTLPAFILQICSIFCGLSGKFAKMLLFVRRWSYFLPCVYLMASIPIFEHIYKVARVVVDEEFHLPQGKHYCTGNFKVWDSKITTFPGLYILTSILLPLKICTTFALRFMCLLASAFNLFLIIKIQEVFHGKVIHTLLDALTITLLPPLYFFAHLYYTDVISVTTILGMYNFWLRGYHKSTAIVGVWSVLMRQTNIIWVMFFLGVSAGNELIINTKPMLPEYKSKKGDSKEKVNAEADMDTLIKVIVYNLKNPTFFIGNISHIMHKFLGYFLVLLAFGAFVLYNGSIVVGDKTAHQATIHLPQILYCTLFILIFGPSLILQNGWVAAKNFFKHIKLTVFLTLFLLIVVKYNTIVHPYLLADNRHYTFYVWNRFYGKYEYAKYLPIPVYIFGLYLIAECLKHRQIVTQIMYFVCLVLVLGLQTLIDVRYFLIPFLILRLNVQRLNWKCYLIDLILYLVINMLTFKIFITKVIHWENYSYPQRLMW